MSDSESKKHWEKAWAARPGETPSWYQAEPARSLSMIRETGAGLDEPLVDVGAGASLLVDHLLEAGYRDLTVLDLSAHALERARARLGERAARVRWVESDVTRFEPDRRYAVWHDRAVFHFLGTGADRARYAEILDRALAPDGQAIIATFAPDGPERCSGLPVTRYDGARLRRVLGDPWRLLDQQRETHVTPSGAVQAFYYFRIARGDASGRVTLQSPHEGQTEDS